MTKNPYAPDFDDLPEILPIFPLMGVLLLPCGELPLNIFEQRFISMIEYAMASRRLIGMIQPRKKCDGKSPAPLYDIGCAGKIIDFSETQDGRYLITLSGITRFRIVEELPMHQGGFRLAQVDWSDFQDDLRARHCLELDRDKLKASLKTYFEMQGMDCCWDKVDGSSDAHLITCLSMICPFTPSEKQALLEAGCCKKRADLFIDMLNMETSHQCCCGDNPC